MARKAAVELVAGKKITGVRMYGKSRRQREMEQPGPSKTGYLHEHPHQPREAHPLAVESKALPAPLPPAAPKQPVRRREVHLDTGTYADALNAAANA